MDIATKLREKLKLTCNDNSLVDMFDDMLAAYSNRIQDAMQIEDQALNMAIHFEKLRSSYVQMHSKLQHAEEDNFHLEKQNKQLITKHADIKSRVGSVMSENEELKVANKELENTLALMKEIVFDNSDNVQKLKLDGEQRSKLVRACSIKSSFRSKAPAVRRVARVEETMDESKFDLSDMSFDDTIDDGLKTPFRGPKAPKRSIDTLKMDDSHFPAANSTVCTDSTYSSSIDSIQKKAKVEIGRSGTAVVTGPAVVTLNPTVKRRSGGNRANGPTSRRRQSRHHRQSILIEEKEEADSFFTPVQAEPTVKARKILGANESQISLEKADLQHRFTSSRVVTIETCRVCFKRIKFATKCHRCSVCRVTIHPECAKNLSLSCAEPSNTKTLTPGRQNIENFLLDKNAKPKIPPQVYLSVHAVDERLNEEGIYRQSGSTKSVQELKKNLLYGDFAEINFDETDVHVLCTFIKDFFRDQLSEPILTYKLLPSFIKNTKSKSQSDLKTLIRRLPDANRDTLAFMCVHLQNVTGAEKQNRMSTIALARSLGPSVVGYQSPNPSVDQIRSGAQYQEDIVTNLLALPRAFYNGFISGSGNRSINRTLSNASSRI